MGRSTAAGLLKFFSVCMIVWALAWSTAPFEDFNQPAIFIMDLLDWPIDGMPAQLDRYDQFLSAVAAGFLAALALVFLLLVAPMIAEGSARARRAALVGLSAWLVLDSLGSYGADISINILWNILMSLPFFVPLMMVDLTKE